MTEKVTIEVSGIIAEHLQLWKDEGIPAPMNELQSIQAWLSCLGHHGPQETAKRMRSRMLILMTAAQAISDAGPEVEDELGIYKNRTREEIQK